MVQVARKRNKKKYIKPTTLVNIILDTSSSMGSVWDSTISAFNEYVDSLRSDKHTNYRVSLTQFNDTSWVRYVDVPAKRVPRLTKHNYTPMGCTALLDAVHDTISALQFKEMLNEAKVLCVILTDGMENVSKRATNRQVAEMISHCEARGNWTFVYMGSHQDTWRAAASLGIHVGNTFQWVAGEEVEMSRGLYTNTVGYSASKGMSTRSFFSGSTTGDNSVSETTS